ncbi:Fic family protein [Arenibacter latericius]|uniref:Fic family protein n=1 Tax=Arenibacter latericius TaxID=86104 RepID=UPI000479FD91|nr:hypothetical protein [Arenibacter latericius]
MIETNRIEYKAELTKDLNLIEQLGASIPRILQSYGRECFKFMDNFTRMVFPTSRKRTEQVTEQVQILISAMTGKDYSSAETMELVGIKHRPTFLYKYLQPAIELGLIELTIPDKPNSS